jgi:hypothetical protein
LSHKVKLHLKLNNDEFIDVCGEFSDSEWEDFEHFVDYAEKLMETDLVKNGGPGSLNVSFNANTGLSYNTKIPDDDKLIGLLHRIRPFILNNERTQFNKICNVLSKHLEEDQFRHVTKAMKDTFSGTKINNMMSVISNNVKINSEEMLHKWLNAYEYHQDRSKQQELESLHKIMPLETSKALFVMMLYEKVKAIYNLANILRVIMGKENKLELQT